MESSDHRVNLHGAKAGIWQLDNALLQLRRRAEARGCKAEGAEQVCSGGELRCLKVE